MRRSARPTATTTRPRRSSRRRRTRSGCCSILAVGERVVANKGTKEILAVGTIESPGYVWDPDRADHNHTLRVSWDESYAKEIPPQPYWAFKTVLPLSSKVRALVLGEAEPEDADEPAPPTSERAAALQTDRRSSRAQEPSDPLRPAGDWQDVARERLRQVVAEEAERERAGEPTRRRLPSRGDGARAWLVTHEAERMAMGRAVRQGRGASAAVGSTATTTSSRRATSSSATPRRRRSGSRRSRGSRGSSEATGSDVRARAVARSRGRPDLGGAPGGRVPRSGRSRFATGCRERCSSLTAQERSD